MRIPKRQQISKKQLLALYRILELYDEVSAARASELIASAHHNRKWFDLSSILPKPSLEAKDRWKPKITAHLSQNQGEEAGKTLCGQIVIRSRKGENISFRITESTITIDITDPEPWDTKLKITIHYDLSRFRDIDDYYGIYVTVTGVNKLQVEQLRVCHLLITQIRAIKPEVPFVLKKHLEWLDFQQLAPYYSIARHNTRELPIRYPCSVEGEEF